MATKLIMPEVKRVNAVVLNKAIALGDNRYKLDVNSLDGECINDLFISNYILEKIDNLFGKIVDIVYKECIAGVTQYICDEDGEEDDNASCIGTHETDHKQICDIVLTNDINLLLACGKLGMKDMFNDLKELQK